MQLSVIGSNPYWLVRNLLTPNRLTDKSYSKIIEVLKNLFKLKPPEVEQWYKFYTRVRKTDEPFVNFVADIKCLSEDYNFNATLEIMIQDRIVCGINKENTHRILLSERNLTFKWAFEIVRWVETTQIYVADLSCESQSVGGKQEEWHMDKRVKIDQENRWPTETGAKSYYRE